MYSISFLSNNHHQYHASIEHTLIRLLAGIHVPDCTIEVLLCSDEDFVLENKRIRGRDNIEDLLLFRHPSAHHPILGTMIINMQQVYRAFSESDRNITHHIDGLLVHGLLHILGYDHMERQEGQDWEDLQNMLQSMIAS